MFSVVSSQLYCSWCLYGYLHNQKDHEMKQSALTLNYKISNRNWLPKVISFTWEGKSAMKHQLQNRKEPGEVTLGTAEDTTGQCKKNISLMEQSPGSHANFNT